MERVDYRYLHAFVVLAGELHFGNAARRLHITQPALSRQIRGLETHLGMPLFIRDRRHVVLSTQGRRLAEAARVSVRHYEKLMTRARSLREGFTGQLKLGYVGSAILDPALTCLTSGYRRIQPEVEIIIEEHNVSDQLTLLLDHELDVGLIRSPVPRYTGLNYLNIATRPLIAAVPHTHPQAAVESIALASLAGDTFMIQQDPPGVVSAGLPYTPATRLALSRKKFTIPGMLLWLSVWSPWGSESPSYRKPSARSRCPMSVIVPLRMPGR